MHVHDDGMHEYVIASFPGLSPAFHTASDNKYIVHILYTLLTLSPFFSWEDTGVMSYTAPPMAMTEWQRLYLLP